MVFSTDGFDISFPFLSLGDESIRVEEKTRDKISILFLSLSRAARAQEKEDGNLGWRVLYLPLALSARENSPKISL